jgi:hypothetical protein
MRWLLIVRYLGPEQRSAPPETKLDTASIRGQGCRHPNQSAVRVCGSCRTHLLHQRLDNEFSKFRERFEHAGEPEGWSVVLASGPTQAG